MRTGVARRQATEGRRQDDDNTAVVSQSSSSRELHGTTREGNTARTGNSGGVDTDPKRQLHQQQQRYITSEDSLTSNSPPTSGGGGWLSGRIRWTWERQAERQTHTTAGVPIGKKSRNPSAAEGFHTEVISPSVAGVAAAKSAERPLGQRVLPGTTRFRAESRSSSDATGPSSFLDPNWEAHADLIRAAFAQHLEQLCRCEPKLCCLGKRLCGIPNDSWCTSLTRMVWWFLLSCALSAHRRLLRLLCRRAAVAAGRERSRQLLLQELSPTASEDGESLSAFGVEWVRGWSETHNFQVTCPFCTAAAHGS